MDGTERLERDHQNLSWADWMDELLKENFEKKMQGWARRRVEAVNLDKKGSTDEHVAEPA